MNRGNAAFLGVGEEDRDAVGGLHGEEETRAVGDGGVTAAGIGRGRIEDVGDVGVELFKGDEGKIGGTEGGLEAATVFGDVFAGVPIGKAEVENGLAVQLGDAAGNRGKTVEEARHFGERGDLERLEAWAHLRSPGFFGRAWFAGRPRFGHARISINCREPSV